MRLGRDYYVRVAGNDYSVDPTAIGRLVDVHAALARVAVSRSRAPVGRSTTAAGPRDRPSPTPPTSQAAAALRQQFQTGHPPSADDHLVRDLADYDRAFGVDFDRTRSGSDAEVAMSRHLRIRSRQIEHYAQALKAPRIRESAARLAEQARDAGWTHEEYLAAVLSREVAAREASGAATRIRSAGFPTRKIAGGLQLRSPTRPRPRHRRPPGHRRVPGQSPQRRAA